MVRPARRTLRETAHDINRNVVARRDALIEEEPMQGRLLLQRNIPLFGEFTRQRVERGFAALDAAAGKMPPRHIGVADEKDPAFPIEDRRAHAERHRPRHEKKEMEEARP